MKYVVLFLLLASCCPLGPRAQVPPRSTIVAKASSRVIREPVFCMDPPPAPEVPTLPDMDKMGYRVVHDSTIQKMLDVVYVLRVYIANQYRKCYYRAKDSLVVEEDDDAN